MKKVFSFLFILFFAISTQVVAHASFDPYTNYMNIMIQSAICGDITTGTAASNARFQKLSSLEGFHGYPHIFFEDLFLLSKIIYAEAGSYWLSDDWKMAVGEVVLNRVASPEFPNTIPDVIYQPGQYYSRGNRRFQNILPDERCVRLALRLLEGERHMTSSVVFQANFRQGSGVYTAFYDRYLGWTYFCFSSRPYLYS